MKTKIIEIKNELYAIYDSTYSTEQDITIYHKRLNATDGTYIGFAQVFKTNQQTKLVEAGGVYCCKRYI